MRNDSRCSSSSIHDGFAAFKRLFVKNSSSLEQCTLSLSLQPCRLHHGDTKPQSVSPVQLLNERVRVLKCSPCRATLFLERTKPLRGRINSKYKTVSLNEKRCMDQSSKKLFMIKIKIYLFFQNRKMKEELQKTES